MSPEQLSERLWRFAVIVGKLIDSLPDTRWGRHVASQLVRSGTASAPNYDEACNAESRADFVHKVSIALKEMRETYGWLRSIVLAELMPPTEIASLMNEAHQLRRILGKSVGTAQARSDSEFHESGAGEISDFEQFGRNRALPEL